jgi:hypothetical protein
MHSPNRGALKTRGWLALGLMLLWLAGCCPPSALERDFGNSVRNNIAQQVVNPRAGLNTTPPVGLTPEAAANEMTNYNKSFTSKEQRKASQTMQTQVTK